MARGSRWTRPATPTSRVSPHQETSPRLAGAFQTYNAGSWDAFVTKIVNPSTPTTGGSLAYSSYLGGTADDYGQGIAVD